MARTGDAQDIPVIFSKAMHDLGSENFEGVDEGAFVISGHYSTLTEHREWNI
jgi:hypothetical protein